MASDPFPITELWDDVRRREKDGDHDGVIAAVDRLLKDDPPSISHLISLLLVSRGVALVRLGKVDRALENFKQATTTCPTDSLAFYNLGLARVDTGDCESAIEHLTRSIELCGTRANSFLYRGRIWKDLQQDEKAASDFARVKELKQAEFAAKRRSRG